MQLTLQQCQTIRFKIQVIMKELAETEWSKKHNTGNFVQKWSDESFKIYNSSNSNLLQMMNAARNIIDEITSSSETSKDNTDITIALKKINQVEAEFRELGTDLENSAVISLMEKIEKTQKSLEKSLQATDKKIDTLVAQQELIKTTLEKKANKSDIPSSNSHEISSLTQSVKNLSTSVEEMGKVVTELNNDAKAKKEKSSQGIFKFGSGKSNSNNKN